MPVTWALQGSVLTLRVIDVVTNQEIERAFVEALASDPPRTSLRLLWDATNSLTPVSSDDMAWRFDLVTSLAKRGALVRVALLIRRQQGLLVELAQTQLQTMIPLIPCEAFSDAAEARAWLER